MQEFRVSVLDEPGQLALVSAALSQKLVNIRTVAGISSVGPMITFITDDHEQARVALDELGLSYEVTEVLTVSLSDEPGELAKLSRMLAEAEININSIYVLGTQNKHTEIAMTVSDPDKAKTLLSLH
jgi:hypothetical protein